MPEMGVRSLDGEDPLEEEMATRSSILAWKIPRGRGRLRGFLELRRPWRFSPEARRGSQGDQAAE